VPRSTGAFAHQGARVILAGRTVQSFEDVAERVRTTVEMATYGKRLPREMRRVQRRAAGRGD
jgi:hypothetical protein